MLNSILSVYNIIWLISVVMCATVITGIVSADTPTLYCYDEDMEGFICFETQDSCEIERENDVLANSKCSPQLLVI